MHGHVIDGVVTGFRRAVFEVRIGDRLRHSAERQGGDNTERDCGRRAAGR